MLVKPRKLVVAAAAGAVLAGYLASAALAGPIEDRQKSMKEQGAMLGVIAKMIKGEAPFDAAQVKAVGDDLVAHFDNDKVLFPQGSDKGAVETWAKAEIWSDNATFMKLFDDGVAAANELAAVTEVAALGPVLGKMGKQVCGQCHERFRRPKE